MIVQVCPSSFSGLVGLLVTSPHVALFVVSYPFPVVSFYLVSHVASNLVDHGLNGRTLSIGGRNGISATYRHLFGNQNKPSFAVLLATAWPSP